MISRELQQRILAWPRATKRLFVVALDVLMALAATWVAFSLRLDRPHLPTGLQWALYALAPGLAVPVFIKFGLYRAIFRYTGLAALLTTTKAVGLYAVLLGLAIVPLHAMSEEGMPRSMAVLQPLVFLLLVGGSRAAARFWLAGLSNKQRHATHRLLIYGVGETAVQTASALSNSPSYLLMGFVDDTQGSVGRTINGVDVYSRQSLEPLVRRLGVTDLLLALPDAGQEHRKRIIAQLGDLPVHVRTLPRIDDLASGRVTVQDFRELDIEDLLGREPVRPDEALIARDLTDHVVLITGAGGSIGGELSRQVLAQRPRRILLVDHSEFALYTIHQELHAVAARQGRPVEILPLLASVLNAPHMERIFAAWRPSVVYHAAAYKHVPMVEHNPAEGVRNNVLGTITVAACARRHGCERFILISTDKAVRPTNLMGASKRVAELVLQALAADATACPGRLVGLADPKAPTATQSSTTRFTMVRFGNVLGSSGSVVPLFRRQLEAGGPLTVTHEEVTRYFMTIPEAVQLVLQAGAMATGGEVFVLDMGEPVRILDLARRIVSLAGLTVRDEQHPDGDIEIRITGLRPGEKLYEELLIGDDPRPTAHPRIMQARESHLPWSALEPVLTDLARACEINEVQAIQRMLGSLAAGSRLSDAVFDHVVSARAA